MLICTWEKKGSTILLYAGETKSVPNFSILNGGLAPTFAACVVARPYQRRLACFSLLLFRQDPFPENQNGYVPTPSEASESLISRYPSAFTLDSRSSDKTLHTSLCLTTSHGWLPSQSSTCDNGSAARSLAYSAGGSAASRRVKGNFGGSDANVGVFSRLVRFHYLNSLPTGHSRHFEGNFRIKKRHLRSRYQGSKGRALVLREDEHTTESFHSSYICLPDTKSSISRTYELS